MPWTEITRLQYRRDDIIAFSSLEQSVGPALILSNHYVVAGADVQGVPRATTVLTKIRSLRAQATRTRL